MLVSELLNTLPASRGRFGEQHCWTSCQTCGLSQTLDLCSVDESDKWETVYSCSAGCGPLLIVATPGVVPWDGRGYRIGNWTIRNRMGLYLLPPGATQPVLIDASPNALE